MRRSEILPLPTASWIGWCTRLTASSCKENRCAKNEAAKTARNDKAKRAVEMAGLWKVWKAKTRLPPLSTAPWKSRRKQARFPHSHSSDDYAVAKWKTKTRFPTFPPRSLMFENRTENRRASPPALRGGASRLPRQRLTANNDECSS